MNRLSMVVPMSLALLLLLVSTVCGAAEPPPASTLAQRCEALVSLDLEGLDPAPGRVVQAELKIAAPATPTQQSFFHRRGYTQGSPTPALATFPDHCSVEGYVTPTVRFRIVLPPPEAWNGRFMLAACDAWCGKVHDEIVVPGLHRGYATLTNDGGHYSAPLFDGIWAYQNTPARIDFAHRANHVTAQAGKAIIRAYYGRPQHHSYITGFSKGGNAGLFAALKYPDDFDGVFSKAPVPRYQWKNTAHFHWLAMAVHPDGKTPVMTAAKVPLVERAVLEACDALDGVDDGIVDDPRLCRFEPGALACRAGQDEAQCLSPAELASVRQVYANPTAQDGTVYYPYGLDPGAESDWAGPIYPLPGREAYGLVAARTGLRYMAFADSPGASYDWTRFDYRREQVRLEEMSKILDPSGSDLHAFKKRGGKLMIVHGWADAYVSARMSIDWYEALQKTMGGPTATSEFAQLYLVPGLHHAMGGASPQSFDALSALERWVEQGIAPEQLLVRDEPGDDKRRERPVFPYPDRAVYDGRGDPDAAASFVRRRGGWHLPAQ